MGNLTAVNPVITGTTMAV